MSVIFNGSQEVTFSVYNTVRISSGVLTICAWVKFTTSQANKGIVGRWGATGSYLLAVSGTANKIVGAIKSASVSKTALSSAVYNTGAWVHAAMEFNGSNVLLKLNAGDTEDIVGAAATSIDDPAADPVEVGSYGAGTSLAFTGSIQDAAIFNRVLTNNELKMVMKYGSHYVRDLRFHWPGWSEVYKNSNLAPTPSKTQGTTTGSPTTGDAPPNGPYVRSVGIPNYPSVGLGGICHAYNQGMDMNVGLWL